MSPFYSKIRFKEVVVAILLLLMAPLYFFLGDIPVNKQSLSVRNYDIIVFIIFTLRDLLSWALFILCNYIMIEKVVKRHPDIELNGLSSAFFVFSYNFGDFMGIILGNVMNDRYGFNFLTQTATIVLVIVSVACLGIKFIQFSILLMNKVANYKFIKRAQNSLKVNSKLLTLETLLFSSIKSSIILNTDLF